MVEMFDLNEEDVRRELKKAGKFQAVKIVRHGGPGKTDLDPGKYGRSPGVEWQIRNHEHYVRTSGLAHL